MVLTLCKFLMLYSFLTFGPGDTYIIEGNKIEIHHPDGYIDVYYHSVISDEPASGVYIPELEE